MENYVVVLFKNKIAKKILNKFITYKRAKLFFDNLVTQSNKVLFNVEFENGLPCEYEIAIIENTNAKLIPVYLTDEYGRNLRVKLEESGKTISEIVKYKKEEKLFLRLERNYMKVFMKSTFERSLKKNSKIRFKKRNLTKTFSFI